jgi:hypothetical protein
VNAVVVGSAMERFAEVTIACVAAASVIGGVVTGFGFSNVGAGSV